MAACGACWPHIHTDLPEMLRCRDYRLAVLYDVNKPATSGQAVAGRGFSISPMVSLSGAAEHGKAVAPLATPSSIFIRIHRRSAIVRRGSGRAPHTHPLLLLAIAAPVYLLLRLSELTSRLALRLARGQ